MATDTEVSLNIEDFFGVNSQVTSEDLKDQFYLESQNLYERKLGEIQPIGGCADLFATAIPSNVVYMGKPFTLKDKNVGKIRMAHVRCRDPIYAAQASFDSAKAFLSAPNLSVSFATDVANGKWGQGSVGITNAFIGCDAIQVIATGFGIYQAVNQTYTSSLPASGDTKSLRVALSSPFTDPNITGLEVYARVINGYTGATATRTWMFVGYIDLVRLNGTTTFAFNNGPITLGADPTARKTIGTGDATFTAAGSTTAGTLIPGKTYYVTAMSQVLDYHGTESLRKCYYRSGVITAVTLGPSDTSILVSVSSAGSSATTIAIGTHPQQLKCVGIVTNASSSSTTITRIPYSGAHVNTQRTADATFELVFHFSAIYRQECFMLYDSTNSRFRAIHISKNAGNVQTPGALGLMNDKSDNYVGSVEFTPYWQRHHFETYTSSGSPGVASGFLLSNSASGNGDWSAQQYNSFGQDLMFLAPRSSEDDAVFYGTTYPYTAVKSLEDFDGNTSAGAKLFQCDGFIVSRIIPDYGYAVPPRFSYIGLFKESLVGAGGPGDAYNRVYFASAFSPYKWGTPNTAATAQYVQVESGGEGVNGVGVYTNTTGTSGPVSQLVISKPNSLWLLSSLPVYNSDWNTDNGAINNAVMTQLSGEVGSAGHETFQNTDIGLITTSIKGVWLIRESGEPTPIGEEIKNLLINEDPSLQQVNTRYWHGVFHDGHYKLVYSVQGAVNPTKELWLNISKMKQMKGQPCWVGPHEARSASGLRFSYSEGPYLNQSVAIRVGTTGPSENWGTMDNPAEAVNFKEPTYAVQKFTFTGTPTSGNWKATYGSLTSANIAWNATAAQVQLALRLMATSENQELANVTVSGTLAAGFSVIMHGITSPSTFGTTANTLAGAATSIAVTTTTAYAAATVADMTYAYETRDFPLGNALMNKLFVRTYWRVKVDQDMSFTEETTVLNELGEQSETNVLAMAALDSHVGGSYTTFLTARQKLYQSFPVLRLRGETIRKRISYQGQLRFAISGLTLGFRPEGRKIG